MTIERYSCIYNIDNGVSERCYTIISKIYDSRGGELSIKGKEER